MITISANRIVYADGSWKPRFLVSVVGSVRTSVWSSILSSKGRLGRRWHRAWVDGRGVVPGPVGGGHLEPDEAVQHVEQRAQDVEEAVREVRRRGHAQHPG